MAHRYKNIIILLFKRNSFACIPILVTKLRTDDTLLLELALGNLLKYSTNMSNRVTRSSTDLLFKSKSCQRTC